MESRDAGPVIGPGFVLRPLGEQHVDLMIAASRSDVPDWTFIPRDLDERHAREWIRRGIAAREQGRAIRFAIEVDGAAAGTVGAQHPYGHDPGIVETFYFVLPEFRRRGLAVAALRLVDDWLRRAVPELRRLQLHVIPGNPGSARVAERAGYAREGMAVHQIPPANGHGVRDAEVYAIAVSGADVHGGGVLA